MNRSAILSIALLSNGCGTPIFSWMTRSPSPWWYVQAHWGGVRFSHYRVDGNQKLLVLSLKVHEIESKPDGFFIYRAKAKVQGDSILISIYKWMEYGPIPESIEVPIDDLKPGSYKVVYNDRSSNFPLLGNLEIK